MRYSIPNVTLDNCIISLCLPELFNSTISMHQPRRVLDLCVTRHKATTRQGVIKPCWFRTRWIRENHRCLAAYLWRLMDSSPYAFVSSFFLVLFVDSESVCSSGCRFPNDDGGAFTSYTYQSQSVCHTTRERALTLSQSKHIGFKKLYGPDVLKEASTFRVQQLEQMIWPVWGSLIRIGPVISVPSGAKAYCILPSPGYAWVSCMARLWLYETLAMFVDWCSGDCKEGSVVSLSPVSIVGPSFSVNTIFARLNWEMISRARQEVRRFERQLPLA